MGQPLPLFRFILPFSTTVSQQNFFNTPGLELGSSEQEVIKAIFNSIWLYQEFFIRSTSLTIIMAIKCLNRENTYLLCKGKYRYTYVLLFYLFKFSKTFKIVNNFIIKQLLNTNDTSTYNFSEYSLPSRDRAVGHVQTWARSSVTRWLDYLSIFGHL